jgi:hypothetical protein
MKEKELEASNTPSLDLDNTPVDPTEHTQTTITKKKDTSPKERATSKKSRATHDEDVIGVDEESMYSDTDSLVALSDSSYDTDLAASSNSDIDSEYDPDVEIVDEDDEDIPPFSYDVDDPCIEVGVVFPDVKQCKEAVTQHAIIHDHAFKATRTDHNKFRAVCKRADKGCKWRFYATTSKNKYIGCKVKYIYTCIFMCCSKNKYITYSCVILMCCR